ncbi:ferredoxin [Rhodococcus rhodochrous]|uniref:Ferredoxin n=1 Tax=Rhodococcus rhodochrous KG-21 TaxID=1441923 RepID=A0A0M8PKJ4_RHORH|nr:ferredoxin [Rhodococcus rhodochrous]KOS58176.1 hypothetical protein Z051_01000 [Rhodococcus rhodochrous KG-21]
MRVLIKDSCQGCGTCEAAVPTVFEVNDDGTAVALKEVVPVDLEQAVREAAYECPTDSISISE